MSIKSIVKRYWPLLLVLLIAGVIRFYGLLQNPISLYSDEVDMGYQALSLLKTGCDYSGFCFPVQFHSFSDVQPPLPIYFIALTHLVGVPLDLSIRLTSAIFGLLGILSTYFLVEKLASKNIFNLKLPGIGLISAILLTLIPWHVTYSRIGFSLTTLYFFVTLGFLFFTEYLIERKNSFLYLSCLFLGLSPMVYNTAKVAIVFYPFILLLLPGAFELFRKNLNIKIAFLAMFIPLVIMFAAGGTTARFDYISIFTDPTAASEVKYQRQLDSGPTLVVGTSPSILTDLFHNKPLFYANNLSNNSFSLISTQFLFTTGDPNLRQSIGGWGMLYHSLFPILLLGIYFLIRFRHDRLILFLGLLVLVAISTSAVTRDGGEHASRSFMMILPMMIICSAGLAYLKQSSKILLYIFFAALLIESTFYFHDYWVHFPYTSERSFSAGMKELIQEVKKYPDQPVIISPKNDNPLIFYAFYMGFDPQKFQQFVKTNTLYNSQGLDKLNLDGNRIGDTNLYIATPIDYKKGPAGTLPGAIYFLSKGEFDTSGTQSVTQVSDIIRLPSGEPLYYEVHY